jgi:predicted DNA-binding transcriptional regulator YafY
VRRRASTIVRVLRLWRMLEGRRSRPPVVVLAQDLGVHPRTVKRDLVALEEAHYPVPPPRRDLFGEASS